MRRPKLFMVVTSPVTAWAFMRGQLSFLKRHGFDVSLISSPGQKLKEVASREDVKSISLPMKREPAPLKDLVSLIKLIMLFFMRRPDIVHAGTPKAGLLGMIAAWVVGVPTRIYTLHGLRAEGVTGLRRSIFLWIEQLTSKLATHVICVSPSLQKRAIELGACVKRKTIIFGPGSTNGIDSKRFQKTPELELQANKLRKNISLPKNATVIGFVGRLVQDKGVVELVDAFGQLKDIFPELHLLFVGKLERYNAIPDDTFFAINNDERIITTGELNDVVPSYLLMDMLVLPSYREGLPYVPLEAAAMELPVVATRVTGCVDAVVDGVTGTLVDVKNSKELANAIKLYVEDKALRIKHGSAGRRRICEEYKPERIWQSQLELYRRA